MKQTNISATAVAVACLLSPVAAVAASPVGVWINDTGRGAVEIKNCGGGLCGHVVWVKSADDSKGCGRQILGEVKSQGGGRWDRGWIYSPEKKQRYDVELTPLGDGRLRVVGYAGMKLFSKTMIWTKAPSDLKRCGDTVAAISSPQKAVLATEKATAVAASAQPAKAKAEAPSEPAPTAAKPIETANAAPEAPKPSAETPPPSPSKPAATTFESAGQRASESAPASSAPVAADRKGAGDPDPENEDVADTSSEEDDPANAPKASGGKFKLGDIDLDSVLKRTGDGRCKLDLPWVKVKFDCDR